MKKYKNFTVQQYLDELAVKKPVPGGGSAAALTASLGVSLLLMVTNYSLGRGAKKVVERKLASKLVQYQKIRQRLIELIDLDAEAYMNVVKARKGTARQKKSAAKEAQKVPAEVCKLCYKAIESASVLVEYGNQHLLSDVGVAIELLHSAFRSATIISEVNT